MTTGYSQLRNELISAVNGVDYASAHGFLFQHHAEFAADVTTFLGDAS